MKNSSPLSHIDNGAIDFYYGLKIETKLSYDNLRKTIVEHINHTIEEYCARIKASLRKDLQASIDDLELQDTLQLTKDGKDYVHASFTDASENKEKISDIAIELTPKGFNINFDTTLQDYFDCMYKECKNDYEKQQNIYGEAYVNAQSRIVLPPIEVEINDEVSYIEAVLIMFKNKDAILRITLNLNNVGAEMLMSNKIDAYIKNAKPVCETQNTLRESTINEIKKYYCQFLVERKEIKGVYITDSISNIILANHSAPFNDIKEIPKETKKDIYKISVAPLKEREGLSFYDEAEIHFKKNSFCMNGIGYITSSTGRCVSIVDRNLISFAKNGGLDENFYRAIINLLRSNIEFSFVILLLKKVNANYLFKKINQIDQNLRPAKNHYNLSKIFISLIQEGAYGSVKDLTEFSESTMIYFVNTQNISERIDALNEIIEDEHTDRVLQLQNAVSILGIVFTTVFGLPAISETLLFLRNLCFFIDKDVEMLSIANCSFVLWLIMISVSILFFVRSKIKKIKKL